MHIHILGICGTFMGGLAVLAKQAGHRVSGCDANVYPPMSMQLEAQGISLTEGFSADQIKIKPDMFVVGNVVTRGNPLMEEILNQGLPYISGPQWLAEHVLRGKWVLGVSGTHGKTTTSSMLAWMLEHGGLTPGFLIGGVPENFGVSARLTESPFFVIEADEYDTAFFDKRSKFIHYRPRTFLINNIEFDHADIFTNLEAIETQFHHLVRTLPSNGLVVANGNDESVNRVLTRGCWTPVEYFDSSEGWQANPKSEREFAVSFKGEQQGTVSWELLGEHNRMNALAAMAAARHVGVPANLSIDALGEFQNVKRRMEIRGVVNGITIYDDFAHHPTAIQTTLAGLREKVKQQRIIAILEPRSNTMRMGKMNESLAPSLNDADYVFCYAHKLGWDAAPVFAPIKSKTEIHDDLDQLISAIANAARRDDHVLIMSNGGFGGIHEKLIARLRSRA